MFKIPFLNGANSRGGVPILICEIGSSSAAAAVVLSGEHLAGSQILSTRRMVPQAGKDAHTKEQMEEALLNAFAMVGKVVLKDYMASSAYKEHGSVQSIHVELHSSHAHSLTRDNTAEFKEPTRVTKEIIQKLALEAVEEDTDAGTTPEGYVSFENKVVHVELSGYITGNPIGKEALSVRAVVLESSAEEAFLKQLKERAAHLVPDAPVLLHSSVDVYNAVLHEVAPVSNSTFLDLGSMSSAAYVVRNDVLGEQRRVSLGTYELARAIMEQHGEPYDSAYSRISMVLSGTCSDTECETVSKTIAGAEKKMIREFGEVFSTLTAESRLPNILTVAVHPKLSTWASNFFGRIDFSQFTTTGRPFQVQVLTVKNMHGLATYAEGVSADSGISTLAAFVHIRSAH